MKFQIIVVTMSSIFYLFNIIIIGHFSRMAFYFIKWLSKCSELNIWNCKIAVFILDFFILAAIFRLFFFT